MDKNSGLQFLGLKLLWQVIELFERERERDT